MKQVLKQSNIQLLSSRKIFVLLFAVAILVAAPYTIHQDSSLVSISKVHAETAEEADERAYQAAQRASRAAAEARAAATLAEKRANDASSVGMNGEVISDEGLEAVAENARRLADNAEIAHRAASAAALAATTAHNENDEAAAIEAADTAVLRATDAQNYNQQIAGIIANPSTAVSNDGAVGYGNTSAPNNVCWLGITQGGFNWEYCFPFWFAYIAYFIIWLASWVLGLSGLILDEVFKYTLVGMSQNLRNITGINIAWQAFRDIANMSFIFILLYIGIRTIIGEGGDSTKKMLRSVIIAAVLINFSLFFTRVLIDASNILAIGFYNGIVSQAGIDPTNVGTGLSTAFMKPLGLTSIFDVSNSASALAEKGFQYVIIMGIGGTAFILTAAFTFLFAAGLFMIRFAVLILLLLLSPLAYAGQILPATQSQAKKWWDSLIGQIIFAPAYLLMIWAVLKIVNNGFFESSNVSFADALAGTGSAAGQLGGVAGASNMGIIVNFVIIIILLNACVLIAKTFAGRSGSFVNKAIGTAEKYARRWTTDAGQRVGSVPVNIGQRAARSGVGLLGRNMGKIYDNTEAKVRQSEFFKANAGALDKMTLGLSTAAGKAVSRSARDTVKSVENVKFGTGETFADVRKANLERDKFITSRQREMDTRDRVKEGIEALKVNQAGLTDDQKKALTDKIDSMEQAINRLTDKEIEMFVEDMGVEDFVKSGIMERMNVRQLQALNKSDKFTEKDKAAFVGSIPA